MANAYGMNLAQSEALRTWGSSLSRTGGHPCPRVCRAGSGRQEFDIAPGRSARLFPDLYRICELIGSHDASHLIRMPKNFATIGAHNRTVRGEKIIKWPSSPTGGSRWYSAIPPTARKESAMVFDRSGPKKVSLDVYIHKVGTRAVRPNSSAVLTSWSGAQLRFGLP